MSRQFVIGTDIDGIYWDIFAKYDIPEDLNAVNNLRLIARHRVLRAVITIEPIIEDVNRLLIIIPAANVKHCGRYDLELSYSKGDLAFPGGVRSFKTTSCDVFEVVRQSCEVDVPSDPLVIAGIIAPLRGYSSYEVAVKNGYTGTEIEWLDYIRKPAVDAAKDANEAAELANEARLSIQADLFAKIESVEYSELEYDEI